MWQPPALYVYERRRGCGRDARAPEEPWQPPALYVYERPRNAGGTPALEKLNIVEALYVSIEALAVTDAAVAIEKGNRSDATVYVPLVQSSRDPTAATLKVSVLLGFHRSFLDRQDEEFLSAGSFRGVARVQMVSNLALDRLRTAGIILPSLPVVIRLNETADGDLQEARLMGSIGVACAALATAVLLFRARRT